MALLEIQEGFPTENVRYNLHLDLKGIAVSKLLPLEDQKHTLKPAANLRACFVYPCVPGSPPQSTNSTSTPVRPLLGMMLKDLDRATRAA